MDEHESGSSTGLIIGMIIGGGVVLLLVVLLVFGAGFFYMARHENAAFAPVAAPPVVVMKEEGPMGAFPEEPVAPPGAPLPAVKGRDRLLGIWETKTPDDGQATLEFLADGTLHYFVPAPEKIGARKVLGRWEVVQEGADRLKVRRTLADNTDAVQDIRFDGPDRFVIEGPGGATYARKPK